MCSKDSLQAILQAITREYQELFGSQLKKVYLYGSYARGDYDDESDIDVVGIVDYDDEELSEANRKLIRTASDLNLEYDVMLSPTTIPAKRFYEYQDALPYFRNILTEGVELVA